jgi:tRNA(fMet)-specific endonuclease VapC
LTRYLLDTNILSDLARKPQGDVANHIRRVGDANVCTSIVVAAELRFGAAKKQSTRLTAQIETLLRGIEIIPFEVPADAAYAYIRAKLELQGKPIGANDLMIAAHSLALSCVLVTDNVREFSRISDLTCVNWLRE